MVGAIIPTGTTSTTIAAVVDYFFTPIVNTFFQGQVIIMLLFFASVVLGCSLVASVLGRLMLKDEDDLPLSSFSPQGVADAAAGTAAFRAGASVDASAKIQASPIEKSVPPVGSFESRMAAKNSAARDKDFQTYHHDQGKKNDVWIERRKAGRKVSSIDTQDLRQSLNKRRKIGRAARSRSMAEYKHGVGSFRGRDMSLPF